MIEYHVIARDFDGTHSTLCVTTNEDLAITVYDQNQDGDVTIIECAAEDDIRAMIAQTYHDFI